MISSFIAKLLTEIAQPLPLPGEGKTALRHLRLLEIGRNDLEVARLAEAHFDALAILAEVDRTPCARTIYGVWASEKKGEGITLHSRGSSLFLNGIKRFCSGASIVSRALITVSKPEQLLIDVDLASNSGPIQFDEDEWAAREFAATHTATATFNQVPISEDQIVGTPGWYLDRIGFWRGACGPAACWAGGGLALAEFAQAQSQQDSHSLAHLGAMQAAAWNLRAILLEAGRQIDNEADSFAKARILALTVRHLVEQSCSDILRRLARAYGPRPLIFEPRISRCYRQLDLYLRQSHAERDLELLGLNLIDA